MDTIKIGTSYVNPSQSCIHAVEQSVISTDQEREISIMKILRLAYECHKPSPVGSKCGSKCVHACMLINNVQLYYIIYFSK
jgi:hypothetical protein